MSVDAGEQGHALLCVCKGRLLSDCPISNRGHIIVVGSLYSVAQRCFTHLGWRLYKSLTCDGFANLGSLTVCEAILDEVDLESRL